MIGVTLALIPLVLFASAVELLISTWSRNIKEAHTYLSLVIFLSMVIGMFLVFFPHMASTWLWLIDLLTKGAPVSLVSTLPLSLITTASAALVVLATTRLLHRDEFVHGS